MARDNDQLFIFTKGELQLIKATFAGNDDLLYAIRKVFLQFELTDQEKKLLKAQITPEVLAVLRKRILPEFSNDFPLTQIADLASLLTKELDKRGVEDMAPVLAAHELKEAYLLQQFVMLADVDAPTSQPISLAAMRILKGKTPEQQYVDTMARNWLLGYIDPMLVHMKTLAGAKDETPEEQEKRLKRDSAQ